VSEQPITPVTAATLLTAVDERRRENGRLVQISCTRLPETFELTYSFDLAGRFSHLRLEIPVAGAELPSITNLFPCAFAYENGLHDLFGVQVKGINVDYKGHFYQLSAPTPFAAPAPAK
jgi:ech hydrogenase subunit D